MSILHSLEAKDWHHLDAQEVIEELKSQKNAGLSSGDIQQRQQIFGSNILEPQRDIGSLKRFLLQFHQPLIYILIIAGIVSLLLGEHIDSTVIFGVVLINGIIGYIQEAKAVRAIESLSRIIHTTATVLRNGQITQVPSTELVPGDMVLLQAGDKIPADLRLFQVHDLHVDESALTGESMPVEKSNSSLPESTALADRVNMAYASTLVTYGQARGVVIAIGNHTEIGKISQMLASAREMETPLTQKIEHFSKVLLYVILGISALAFVVGILRGQPVIDMLMAAVALAVAAIPEGLPAAVTITLALGVSRMAKRKVIIRKLPAVETLGSTTVICSDKTGTLTENQMTVQTLQLDDTTYTLSGHGYSPNGEILQEGQVIMPASHPGLLECLKAGVLCNDSQLKNQNGHWSIQGDPTEGALLVAAQKGGLNIDTLQAEMPRLDTIPFASETRLMATLHVAHQKRVIYIKGAVESLLERCTQSISNIFDRGELHRRSEELASEGMRVIGLAKKEPSLKTEKIQMEDLNGLTFLGMVGMLDPPRLEAVQAVNACQQAGIAVKMITGDHVLTASAIAQNLHLTSSEGEGIFTLTGQELASFSDEDLREIVWKANVFARVTPEQKLRLVKALQARNQVVAMTGDGVNDAPALKQADIGIAMGDRGTEVAREAAAMILTDDNFASIQAAVEEGRHVFDNLMKIFTWTLPTNLGEGLIILAAILLGTSLPILPVQILWINMTTVGVLGLILAMEPQEPDLMTRQPLKPGTAIITSEMIFQIVLVSILILLGSFGLFTWELQKGASTEIARTVAVNAVVIIELFYLFNCRSLSHSVFKIGIFSNRWVFGGAAVIIILQLVYTYYSGMHFAFGSAPIKFASWLHILAVGMAAYLVVELRKWFIQRTSKKIKGVNYGHTHSSSD